jgi:hypothetical protein
MSAEARQHAISLLKFKPKREQEAQLNDILSHHKKERAERRLRQSSSGRGSRLQTNAEPGVVGHEKLFYWRIVVLSCEIKPTIIPRHLTLSLIVRAELDIGVRGQHLKSQHVNSQEVWTEQEFSNVVSSSLLI